MRSRASATGSVASSSSPSALRAVCETGLAQGSVHLLDDAAPDHLVGARGDSAIELVLGELEPDDDGRSARLLGPEPLAGRRQRRADRCELERADDTSAIVHVYRLCGSRIELGEKRMGLRGIVVVGVFDPRARGSVDRRRDLELSQRGAEIETGAARDDRCPTRGDQMVDGFVRESGVFADRHRLTEAADPDEVRGLGWLVGQDRQSAIDLERVGGDDVGAERIRDAPCDCRLTRCRRAEDRDHFVPQFGHVSWGTPAHHPLQA